MVESKKVQFKTVFKTLVIDDELSSVMPPATEEEDARLERSIRDSGYYDCFPLIVWKGTDILVDGNRRYRYCQKYKVPFSVAEKEFGSRTEVINYICDLHLNQKNLNRKSQTYLIGKMYELEEQHQAELKEHEAKEKDEFLDSAVRAAEIKKATEFHKDACIIFTNTGVDPDELFEKMVQGIDDFISKIAKADSETQKRIVRDIMEGKTAWKLCPIK